MGQQRREEHEHGQRQERKQEVVVEEEVGGVEEGARERWTLEVERCLDCMTCTNTSASGGWAMGRCSSADR